MKIIALILIVVAVIFAWSLCMVASTSDEQAEKMYRDYLEYKRKKNKEDS